MLTNETISKLQDMRLGVMAKQFREQMDDPQFAPMSFEDRFSILVDAEWTTRKSNHLKSLIKNAGYAISGASVEDTEYLPERKLDKSQILRLASCAPLYKAGDLYSSTKLVSPVYFANSLYARNLKNYRDIQAAYDTNTLDQLIGGPGAGFYNFYKQGSYYYWLMFGAGDSCFRFVDQTYCGYGR